MTLFVDTSAFYAAADRADRSHERARGVLGAGEPLVTTDHVLAEAWLLIHHRLGRPAAMAFWEAVRRGASAIEYVGPADLEAAWHSAGDFPDQDFSIVDLSSFAVMERIGVLRAASLDDDFAVFRFGRGRDRAFEIVR
ncbi:MAG: PIN domain-containing protein [Thermoleophilaceae bacterium]|nr:PIN domain-containing protein [Thermoleophilaceae bacterium]